MIYITKDLFNDPVRISIKREKPSRYTQKTFCFVTKRFGYIVSESMFPFTKTLDMLGIDVYSIGKNVRIDDGMVISKSLTLDEKFELVRTIAGKLGASKITIGGLIANIDGDEYDVQLKEISNDYLLDIKEY